MPKEEEKDKSFVSFYKKGATIHMSLKISKDGLSREEDTDVLHGMYDEEKGRNVGWRIMKKVYGDKEKENGVDNPEQ